ncbi:H-type small acid-soluble spore protein [Cohnella sp. CFH 77786]|uniref:H-type small acid-soluble spore protein n=1 Tax=Cohnella sp. CFH 77786 TaxID=2662265 RepID=UPI001C608EFE|nr:H-type small acid-soluble spore protein [Cohnella sp. CFH 77786]MBW5446015.1 H-type small acid-soluble spore protein [Cohnella sp. CFH 77786]
MNAQRAKEIAESPEMVDVSYYGVPVYIQHVNAGAGTARIFPLDKPGEEQTVPLDTLTEGFETETDLPFV